MELTDLAPLERWMELENEIHRRFAIDANVFDPKGFRITPQKHWVNPLCPAVKDTDKGQSFICAPAHMNIAAMAAPPRARGRGVRRRDDQARGPDLRGDEFLGAVGACGVRFEDSEIDAFLVHKMTGIDEEKVETLAATVPSISREKAEELVGYIQERLRVILEASGF